MKYILTILKFISLQTIWLYICVLMASFVGIVTAIFLIFFMTHHNILGMGKYFHGGHSSFNIEFSDAISLAQLTFMGPVFAAPILIIFFLPLFSFLEIKQMKNIILWIVPSMMIAAIYARFLFIFFENDKSADQIFWFMMGIFTFTAALTGMFKWISCFYIQTPVNAKFTQLLKISSKKSAIT